MREFLKLILAPFMIAAAISLIVSLVGLTYFLGKLGYALIFNKPSGEFFMRIMMSLLVFVVSCCILEIYDKLDDDKKKKNQRKG